MNRTVFVTGGSGYIGRNLIRGLVQSGRAVRALARSGTSASAVEALGAEAVRGDLMDEAVLERGMQGCWGLIHAAADTDHRAPAGDAAQERVNVEGTQRLMRSARRAGVQRALLISSEAVLSDGRPLIDVDESRPIPSLHAGGCARSKALSEQAALAASADGFVVCAIRPRFVWGRDDTSALPEIVAAGRAGRLKWIDGGGYLTSTAHVANVVEGALAALQRGAAGQVYFITDGPPVVCRTFLGDMLATQGVEPPNGNVPRWLIRALVAIGTALQGLVRRAHPAAAVGAGVRDHRAASHRQRCTGAPRTGLPAGDHDGRRARADAARRRLCDGIRGVARLQAATEKR